MDHSIFWKGGRKSKRGRAKRVAIHLDILLIYLFSQKRLVT